MCCFVEVLLTAAACGGVTIFLYWLAYSAFGKVSVEGCKPWGNKEMIAYKCAAGNNNSFGKLFNEVKSIVPNGRIFVLFYNSAHLSEISGKGSLYAIGFAVEDKDYSTWTEKGFRLFLLEQVNSAVLASYPLRWRFSESLAVRRIYPELSKYIKRRNLCAYPAIEVYDYKKKEVTFVQPLVRQCCFYVPEATDLE